MLSADAVANYANILNQNRAAKQRNTASLVGGIGQGISGVLGGLDEQTAREKIKEVLAAEGLDPNMVVLGPQAVAQAIYQKRAAKLQAQQQQTQFGYEKELRGMPTYSDTQQDESAKALGAAFQPQTKVPFLEPQYPSPQEGFQRFLASGKVPPQHLSSLLGAVQRPEIASMQEAGRAQRHEADLSLKERTQTAREAYQQGVLGLQAEANKLRAQGLTQEAEKLDRMILLAQEQMRSREGISEKEIASREKEGAANRQVSRETAALQAGTAQRRIALEKERLATRMSEVDKEELDWIGQQILQAFGDEEKQATLEGRAKEILAQYRNVTPPKMGLDAVSPPQGAPAQKPAPPGWVRLPDGTLKKAQ